MTKFHNFKPWMHWYSGNKYVEINQWLKNIIAFMEILDFPGRSKANHPHYAAQVMFLDMLVE